VLECSSTIGMLIFFEKIICFSCELPTVAISGEVI
jgi:hypothetical protein